MELKILPTLFRAQKSLFRRAKKCALAGIPAALLLVFFFGCCSANAENELPEKYGADYYYFAGLNALRDDPTDAENSAREFFQLGYKKSSSLFTKKCAEELMRLGTEDDQLKAIHEFTDNWQDDDSLLIACEALFALEKYTEISKLTNKIENKSAADTPAQLTRLRLMSLAAENTSAADGSSGAASDEEALLAVRLAALNRDYAQAYTALSGLRSRQTDEAKYFARLSLAAFSDVGRIMVYGNARYAENARLFDRIAEEAENTPLGYSALFYAGRLYERSGNNAAACERFLSASDSASEPAKKDDALWYYFTTLLKTGTDAVMNTLEHEKIEFSDKSYFSDFFDSLALALLQNKLWDTFYAAACLMPGIVADDTVAKYAYLAGRLLEEGLAAPGVDAKPEAERLFRSALLPGASLYYKLLAANKLKLNPDEVERLLLSTENEAKKEISAESGLLLDGYTEFGYPERIYPEWLRLRNTLADNDALNAASFLQSLEEPARIQGIRIAANTVSSSGALSKPLYRLAYPRFYTAEIEAACVEFPLPEYVMYGLVRSESFFERTVISRAGAHGLTQLMDATAGDIAGRLKMSDYDVNDAQTNIRFGTYYLANLARQFEGSMLPAVFAYNAGATRVRTWLRASNLPRDLFLETIPFQETRNYGRNVTTAAALYGWLYYDVPPTQIVQAFFLP